MEFSFSQRNPESHPITFTTAAAEGETEKVAPSYQERKKGECRSGSIAVEINGGLNYYCSMTMELFVCYAVYGAKKVHLEKNAYFR